MMKKKVLTTALVLLCLLLPQAADAKDVIVMVDVSASMEPYFDDLREYFLGDMLPNVVRFGDTFHFLSFSAHPEREIAQPMEDRGSIERIVIRIQRMDPIGLYTDLVAAIGFLADLSDGIHDPPPDSPHTGSRQRVLEELLSRARILRRSGWSVHILQMPLDGGEADRQPEEADRQPTDESLLDELARELDADVLGYSDRDRLSDQIENGSQEQGRAHAEGTQEEGRLLEIRAPAYLGRVASPFKASFSVRNLTDQALDVSVESLSAEGEELLYGSAATRVDAGAGARLPVMVRLPGDISEGRHEIDAVLRLEAEGRRISEPVTLSFLFSGGAALPVGSALTIPLYLLLAVVAAALLFLLVLSAVRSRLLTSKLDRYLRPSRSGSGFLKRRRSGELIEMRVSQQNPHIGFRNIHPMDPGRTLTVGGGRSSFLIFLVPFPSHIAEISRRGDSYTFTPVKPAFFPELSGPVEGCLYRDLPARSGRGYPVTIRFIRYVSPLEEINRILKKQSDHHSGDPEHSDAMEDPSER